MPNVRFGSLELTSRASQALVRFEADMFELFEVCQARFGLIHHWQQFAR